MTMTLWLRFFVYYCRLIVMPAISIDTKNKVPHKRVRYPSLIRFKGDIRLSRASINQRSRDGSAL